MSKVWLIRWIRGWKTSLFNSAVYKLMYGNRCVGYAAQKKQTLQFFHVRKKYFRDAPALLERFVSENGIKRVFVITQDSLLCALIAEWNAQKKSKPVSLSIATSQQIPLWRRLFSELPELTI